MSQMLINLKKLYQNAISLQKMLGRKKISLMAITKVVAGDLNVIETLIEAGIDYIGDSRLKNIIHIRNQELNVKLILIRVPSIQEIPDVVAFTDYSVQSELKTIKTISKQAIIQGKTHKIILMVDMGDLREGIHPNQINHYIEEIKKLQNVQIKGIATNLKCFGGIIPDQKNMQEFSKLAERIQNEYEIQLDFVSAGNSANLQWLAETNDVGLINNLRIGEALFFGWETIDFKRITSLHSNIFTLKAQIVEKKIRNLEPRGTVHSNAFGEQVSANNGLFSNNSESEQNNREQFLLNIGRQDVDVEGLIPVEPVRILGASSDYLIATPTDSAQYKINQSIHFKINYSALMRLMVSPYVEKRYMVSKDVSVPPIIPISSKN
ncbi:MAG: alanine racemase [Promethearchaeota archaeon]